jgi:NAD(P)-dependent dehydrogenase (short-subunit alcohol dehydrogenase family)
VHLAGGFAMAPLGDTTLAAFRDQHDVNAVTCFLACREAARAMKGSGGRIVNVSSRPALVPTAGMIGYSTSKAVVAALTRHLAEELRADGILVNAVAPSTIDSPANRKAMPKADFAAWPKPREVAEAIAWLASPDNTLTSGAIVPVYGKV